MVQVLPQVPSFGNELATVLGNAIGNIGASYVQGQQTKKQQDKDQMILDQLLDDTKSPMEKISLSSQLSKTTSEKLAPLLSTVLKEETRTQGKQSLLQKTLGPLFNQMSGSNPQATFLDQTLPQNQQEGLPQGQMPMESLNAQVQGFDASKIPEEAIVQASVIDQNVGNTLRQLKESALQQQRFDKQQELANKKLQQQQDQAQKTLDLKKQQGDRKERFDVNKLSEESYKKIEKDAESSKKRLRSFDVMEKDLRSNKLDPSNFRNILANLSKGTVFEGLLSSPEREEFKTASINSYEGMKDMFGVRLSDADLQLASSKVPSPEKTPDQNLAIINFWRFYDKMAVEKQKIADTIIEKNSGYRPIDFDKQVRSELEHRYGEEAQKVIQKAAQVKGEFEGNSDIPEGTIRMFKNGQPYNIPLNKVMNAQMKGYNLNER